MRRTGFTLELDGSPDEVERVLDAVEKAFARIVYENRGRDEEFTAIGMRDVYLRPAHSMHGKLTVRHEIKGENDE